MGSTLVFSVLDGALSRDQVREWFDERQEQARYESGNKYSGDWGELKGVVFKSARVSSVDKAIEYIEQYAEKAGPAIAIKARKQELPPLTINGQPVRNSIGQYSQHRRPITIVSLDYVDGVVRPIPVDQLTASQKSRALAIATELLVARQELRTSKESLNKIVERIQNVSEPLTTNHWLALKSLRPRIVRQTKKVVTLEEKLWAIEQALEKRRSKKATEKIVWCIGG